MEDREKLSRIEELKGRLFSKNFKVRLEHRDSFPHFKEKEVKDVWEKKDPDSQKAEKFFMKTSMFKKFFIFSTIFFVLSLGYALYMFFANSNTVSNDNIDISILSNNYTAGGEEYPLLLKIANRNNSPLELVDLVVEYAKSSGTNFSQDNERLRFSLGTIPAGGVKNENVRIVLFGEQGSASQIKISLEYRVEGSNAIFVKEKYFDVAINSTPIDLSLNSPGEAGPNQDFSLQIKATLNATKPAKNMILRAEYPIGFQFISSSPAPSLGNNVWRLGDLAPGTERSISVLGKMVDVSEGEEKIFRISTGTQKEDDKSQIGIFFNSKEHRIAVKKSSISATLMINGVYEREYAIDTKSSIQGKIRWANNLETKISNLQIRAKISGNAVNKKSVSSSDGFYDSLKETIVWDRNSNSRFVEINPGEEGDVSFSLSPTPLFSSLGLLSSPAINIDVLISGEQIDSGGRTELSNKETKTLKIISDLGISGKAFYNTGSFKNIGPIPPKVENKTTYTIVWSLSNTSNNISKAVAKATLPPWVNFVGSFSPPLEDLSYNASDKEIVWNIGGIPKGAGITEAAREVSFQVELVPSISQIGTEPVIINNTVLTGHDDFANVLVRVNKSSLNTRINEAGFLGGSRVIE